MSRFEVQMKVNHRLIVEALSPKCLVVASVNESVKDWSAYIDGVNGLSHKVEYLKVYQHGSKLAEKIARVIFPRIAKKYNWRS